MGWITSDRGSRLPDDWETHLVPMILSRDNHRCRLKLEGCKVMATEVDHRVPGDDHRPENLQAACDRCHAKKSSNEGHAAKARLKALRRRPEERHPGMI